MIYKKKNIIAFSGLGGSGKTTHITNLKSDLKKNGFTFYVFVMRENFLWPKISIFLKGLFKKTNTNIEKTPQKENRNKGSLFVYTRAIFYLFDFWRVYLKARVKSNQRTYLIFDRYFEDFIIELNLSSNIDHSFLLKLLPKPKAHIYIKASPQTVYNRKKEAELVFIEEQEKHYNNLFDKKDYFVISGERDLSKTFEKIYTLLVCILKSSKHISFYGFILNKVVKDGDFSYFEDRIYLIDIKKLLFYASYNRVLWLICRKLNESSLGNKNQLEELLKVTTESDALTLSTIDFIKTNFDSSQISFAKNDKHKTELSGDVDIIFSKKYDYQNFKESLLSKDIRVETQNKNKFDAYPKDLKPIDVHLGLEFGNIQYISKKYLEKLTEEEVSFLSIIAHAFSELSMFNWGDLYKLKNHQVDVNKLRKIAQKNGWKHFFDKTINMLDNPIKYGFSLPIFYKSKDLFGYRLKMFLLGKISPSVFMKESITLLRCLRARNKGSIPFHPEWGDIYVSKIK